MHWLPEAPQKLGREKGPGAEGTKASGSQG